MPEGAVYVGRPGKWGNPYPKGKTEFSNHSAEETVRLLKKYAERTIRDNPDSLEPLRGKELVCWCPLEQACHADVLQELAN
jgi:hypothetical protein